MEVSANRRYTISSSDKSYSFRLGRLTSPEASRGAEICNDKAATKQYFDQNALPTPSSRTFQAPFNKDDILRNADEIGYPLCLKATNWSKGKGVYPAIASSHQLRRFLNVLIDDLLCESLMLEEHFEGEDFRFFVAGDTVSGVIQRIAANVIGDGESSVAELIEAKNNLRSCNPYLKGALIKIDDEVDYMLEKRGYDLSSVLPEGERLFLREKSNASAGGDSVDVTAAVSQTSKDIAVEAIRAIPGIQHGGVDMLLRHPFTDNEEATLIEINQSAEIGLHLYPAYGEGKYPPEDIINLYFPESRRKKGSENWYFDLAKIFAIIRSGVAERVMVKPMPDPSRFEWLHISISGKVQAVGFRKWVVRTARELRLHGEVKNTSSGDVHIDVCGRSQNLRKLEHKLQSNMSPGKVEAVVSKPTSEFVLVPGVKIVPTSDK